MFMAFHSIYYLFKDQTRTTTQINKVDVKMKSQNTNDTSIFNVETHAKGHAHYQGSTVLLSQQ